MSDNDPWLSLKSGYPVLLLIAFNLVVGLMTFRDYGASWDETQDFTYAADSFAAYTGTPLPVSLEKGPFYLMAAMLGSDLVQKIHPGLLAIEAHHLMNFLTFQLGLIFLFWISKRLMNRWAAFVVVLMFTFQPLLWGHAFINEKDLPFMTFFMGSIALGLGMVDWFTRRWVDMPGEEHDLPLRQEHQKISEFRHEWDAAPAGRRLVFLITGVISLAILLLLTLGADLVLAWMAALIEFAYQADPGTPLGAFFARLAVDRNINPVEVYIEKGVKTYPQLVFLFLLFALALNLALASWVFPTEFWKKRFKSILGTVRLAGTSPPLIGAALFLGFCTSIRVLGPIAGVFICVYFLSKHGRRALPALLVYFVGAGIVTYLTWPGLWQYPIYSFVEFFAISSEFPWLGDVLFNGNFYQVTELPRIYLPVLLSLQFTEPFYVLLLLGLILAIVRVAGGSKDRSEIILLLTWFFFPLVYVVIFQPNIYDNFRHFLFIIPPIFVVGGLGLEAIIRRINRGWLAVFLVLIVISPGVYWGIELHPYQYVYYNSWIGGVAGAYRNYELDYWVTSYREAEDYLSKAVPEQSTVAIWGPAHLVSFPGQKDLQIEGYRSPYRGEITPDFVLLPTRFNKDQKDFPEAEEVFKVERAGAVFAVVKKVGE